MSRGPPSERAFRRRPSYHLPFVSFTHLYGALPERASFSLPFCPIFPVMVCGPSRPAYHCLSVQFAPVMALGPSSERALRRRPVIICLLFHLPTFMARALSGPTFHCLSSQLSLGYGARSERTSLSLPFCASCPRYGARPVLGAGGQLSFAFCFICPPLWLAARVGKLLIAILPNFPPLLGAARAGQLIVCLSAQFAPVLACGSSGPAYQCLAALYRAARAGHLIICAARAGQFVFCLYA